jgi:anti-sigma factor RsiW
MTCRETRPLLPLFFDGELEARQMRAVALHSTRCPDCETELRYLEHLQDAVASHISTLVDDIDLGQVWAGVAPRLGSPVPSLGRRLRAWWEEREGGWMVRGPAFAGVAAALLLTLVLWPRDEAPSGSAALGARGVETASRDTVDNSAVLDSVQSSVDSVALVTDAETNTTLLWIMDEGGGTAAEHSVDQWEAAQ